jgi:hypothetical protein
MTRYLKILFLATLVIGLMAGSAFAQAQLAVNTKTVALERTSATAATRTTPIAPAASVVPVFQTGGAIAAGEIVTLTVANGVITADRIDLCEAETSVANGTLTSDGTTVALTFSVGVGGGTALTIRSEGDVPSCGVLDTFIVQINGALSAGSSVTLTTSGDPIRMNAGPANLYTLVQQFTAVLTPVTSRISFSGAQKNFVGAGTLPGSTDTTSEAKLTLTSATIDDAVSLDVTDEFRIRVTGNLSGVPVAAGATDIGYDKDNLGAAEGGIDVVAADVTAGFAQFLVTGANIGITGTDAGSLFITVDGSTTLSARSFTVIVATVAKPAPVAGQIGREVILLNGSTSHTWILDSTNFVIPLVGFSADGTRETYIKIFSKSSAAGANAVTVNVLATDGTMVMVALTHGTITPGVAFTIKGSELGAGVPAGKTVDGVQGFPVILSINTPAEDLFIFANIIDPSGSKVIPVRNPALFGPS